MADAEFENGILPDFDKDHEYVDEKKDGGEDEKISTTDKKGEDEPIEEINTDDHADNRTSAEDGEGLVELDYSLYDL